MSAATSLPSTTRGLRWSSPVGGSSASSTAHLRDDAAPTALAKKIVLVAGVGAVGGSLCQSLARLGTGLVIVDPDSFGPDSFRTQWCDADDVGSAKAILLAERLRPINPAIQITAAEGCVQELPWQLLHRVDALVSSGDNLQMLIWLGQMAAAFGKPLVQGAVHRETDSAIVRRWNLNDADSACPACAAGVADWNRLAARQGCDFRRLHPVGTKPTRTTPFVCITAGQMAVAEVIKLLSAAPPAAVAQEVLYSLQTHRLYATVLERRTACRCQHRRWQVESLPERPEQLTLRDLVQRSPWANWDNWRELEFSSESPWCHVTACWQCHRRPAVRRFAYAGDPVGECICGAPLTAQPFGLRRVIPLIDLMQRAGEPLPAMGFSSGQGILIDDGESAPWCGFAGPLDGVPIVWDEAPSPNSAAASDLSPSF